ncbi:MAG TPA: hypothetical protein VK348_05985 [Planctomycetota bacterium]|nr:hypothetical protein [Planctomycetota bacterium]
MRFTALLAGALGAALHAQGVNDVGLTMNGASTGQIFGQSCGPVGCTPFTGGTIPFGASRQLTHWAVINTPYAIAIALPQPCWQFPGIANDILLAPPIVTLAVGVVSQPALTAACRQAVARATLVLPPAGPSGIVVRLQSLGVSGSGAFAFGPAIEVTVL